MTWRKSDDPMAEARRLGVDKAVTNLKWSPARLEREMGLSDSAKMFVGRVRSAVLKKHEREVNTRWYMHVDLVQAWTHSLAKAVRGEPEGIRPDEQNVYSMEAERRQDAHDREYRGEKRARDQVRSFAQELRDTSVRMHRMGLDPVPMIDQLRQQVEAQREQLRSAA